MSIVETVLKELKRNERTVADIALTYGLKRRQVHNAIVNIELTHTVERSGDMSGTVYKVTGRLKHAKKRGIVRHKIGNK